MSTAYLLYGFDLGDLDSVDWGKEQCARFGRERLEDCEKLSWLFDAPDEDGYRSMLTDDFPEAVARQVLKAWYTPEDLAEIFYGWSFLEEQKGMTVVRVGDSERNHLVLAAKPYTKADEYNPAQPVTEVMFGAVKALELRQAFATLGLEGDGPKLMVATLYG